MTSTTAKFIVNSLIDNGIDYLYCLPGVQNDDFFDAIYDRKNELVPIHTRHEQGAVYMAMGAALATGKPQAFSIVPGPGFLNGCAALATAYAVNAPLLGLVGQIPVATIGKEYGVLHEIENQLETLQSLTKHAQRISSGDETVSVVSGALRQLQSGRPRPVGIEIPVNVWNQRIPADPADLMIKASADPVIRPGDVARAVLLIQQAKNPLIVVGSGAQNSSLEVTQLANAISAPVAAFRTGHGVVSAKHDLCIGLPEAHSLWGQCDLVIGLGTRLQTQQMQWGVDGELAIIHIDIDDRVIGRINEPTLGIHGALEDVLPMLLSALGDSSPREEWRATVKTTKARFEASYKEKLAPQLEWLQAIRDELPVDGIFVDELTQVGYVSRFAFPTYFPRTFLSTGYQGTLGWGIATALGAAHARQDVPVVSVSGDGGALYTISELATAAHHNIPLTCIIFKDNAFGNVKRFQIDNYNNRPIASDLTSPDFVKLAESFGVRGLRATTPDQLRQHLKAVLFEPTPTVIEVPVGEFPSPWEFILMPKVRGL